MSFFFFSSRRRHTRSLCDWSSDVCSSDLVHAAVLILIIEMRCNEVDELPVDTNLGANESAALGFARVEIKMVIGSKDRGLRKNCDAVLSTLVLQIKGERIIHLR